MITATKEQLQQYIDFLKARGIKIVLAQIGRDLGRGESYGHSQVSKSNSIKFISKEVFDYLNEKFEPSLSEWLELNREEEIMKSTKKVIDKTLLKFEILFNEHFKEQTKILKELDKKISKLDKKISKFVDEK